MTWCVMTGVLLSWYFLNSTNACELLYSPSDQQLFSGSSDNSIKVWSVKTYELLASISAHDNPVCTLACNDTLLFSGSLRSIKVL